jgi:hypothetical protein
MSHQPLPTGEPLCIRTCTAAYVVVGSCATGMAIVGAGLMSEGHIVWGLLTVALAPAVFTYLCFQRLTLVSGELTLFRPFLPTVRVPLSDINSVKVVWNKGRGTYRRYYLSSHHRMLCSFNPKLFPYKGISQLLEQIRLYSPNVVIQVEPDCDIDPQK